MDNPDTLAKQVTQDKDKQNKEQKYTANLQDEHYGSHQKKCEDRGEGVNPDGREG